MLAGFGYDAEGRRTSLAYGNGTSTSYGYDPLGRPASLSHDLLSGGSDVTFGYAYNPAGQIVSRSGAHGLYAWTGHGQGSTATAVDGRNFLTSVGGATASQDARGNLLSDGSASYGYNLKNQLVAKSGTTQLYYEPLGRLTQQWNGGGILDWAGDELVAEVHRSPNRRYVHGDAADDPMIWYEGTSKRYLHADERGSIVAISDSAGNAYVYNSYDEYGRSANGVTGRFGYTGQAWLPEIGVYYYKARAYDPGNARFLQSDRLGYVDGLNMWAYVGGDPVNRSDPTGMLYEVRPCLGSVTYCGVISASNDIVVEGHRRCGLGKICFDISNALVLENANGITAPRMVFNTDGGGGGGGGAPQRNSQCPQPPARRPVGGVGTLTAGAIAALKSGLGFGLDIFRADAERFSASRYPGLPTSGNIRDASRHFYLSFSMSRMGGAASATQILNSIEVLGNNPTAEQRMDTHNNFVGVSMAQNPVFRGKSAAEAFDAALAAGCLITNAN